MEDGKKREVNVYLHHKDGQRVPVTIRTVPLKNEKNEIVGAAELFLKNIKMKSLEEKINELKQENHRDKLTEINNRKYLEKILAEIVERDDIKKDDIAFCFLDVDDFKYINDNFGHLVGDKILSMIAKTLKNNLRDSDKAFRWGGDEFALLLFDINNNKKLFKLLERLKLLINESFINHKQEKLSVTMSFGATKLSKNDTIESLTKRADNNMYESKKQGKNQITVN
jgi:diguanylate cyclase (GGDEF)-like protein